MQTEREQNDPKLFRTAARFIASPTVGGRWYWSDEVGEDKLVVESGGFVG